jgi:hypothetical protein
MAATTDEPAVQLSEPMQVWWNRYEEAREAGMRQDEARVFAEDGRIDVGVLRKLVADGCPADKLAAILL